MLRPLAVLGVVLLTALTAWPVRAADPDQPITVMLKDVPLRQAIDQVCKEAGVPCTVEEGVPDTPVSLNVLDVRLLQVLRLFAKQAGPEVGIARQGDRYLVRLVPITEQERDTVRWDRPDPRLGGRLTFSLRNVPLRQAWARILGDSGVQWAIYAEVPDVPISLKFENETVFEAIHRLFDAASAVAPELLLERDRGIYLLTFQKRDPPNPAALETLRTKRVTLALKEVTLREAALRILTGSGLQFSFHRNVPDLKVSLDAKDATLEEALKTLIRGAQKDAPGLTLSQSGDVFIFERRGPPAPPPPMKGML